MAASLVGGAALGAAFGELLKAVLEIEHKNRNFEKTLAYIRTTLTAIHPLIREIEQQNSELGRPKEEHESLIRDMEDGTKLVYKCSKICRCNLPARIHHQEQLAALVESLLRFFIIDIQAQTARDLKETLITVRRIHSAINKMPPIRTEEISADTSCSANLKKICEKVTNQSSLPNQLTEEYTEKFVWEEVHQSMSTKKSEDPASQITQNMEETKSNGDKRQAEDNLVESQSNQELYKDEETSEGGVIVGAAFGELMKAVMEMKDKAVMFKSTLSYLQTTLMAIDPVIKEIDHHDNINNYLSLLGRPTEELRLLIKQIAEVTNLVYKSSRIHKLNYIARIRCQEQLLAMVESLVKFFVIDMQY
ncbi:hypothetical protein PIB30_071855 [Stylosanthes scabra]|uniref:RPW8 domain-containing protein n=1 Tax=Stylosanthes scabra TaxID=79078 RepID=A0ABU6WRP7_9FABA|nr:hypothetical protein [Stylosanthes scabra]